MKRMTMSLIATVAILVVGVFALWLLVSALRGRTPAPIVTPPVPSEPGQAPIGAFDGALNLYVTAPERLPVGAGRVELALVKAVLVRADGLEAPFFEGSRRIMLQQGVTEKALSERIPNGRWTRLKLTFSPAADLAFADGRPSASAVVERREAVLSFDAEVPASRTLALFTPLPLEAESGTADSAVTLAFSPDPRPAERYVFGAFHLDPRDRGDLWSIESPTLARAVKEDLGLDITRQQTGSTGFVPADRAPETAPPRP